MQSPWAGHRAHDGTAAIQLDGQFVDYPIIESAQRLLAVADAIRQKTSGLWARHTAMALPAWPAPILVVYTRCRAGRLSRE